MRDEDIPFHNGDVLTPQMLATHLKTMQLAPLTFFTFKPLNAVAVVDEAAKPRFDAGEISEEEYDVLRRQVIVTMTEPWSTFPAFLASYQVGYMVHPDYVAGEIEEPMGTGPFTFEEWVPGDHLTTRRNPDYWRAGLPYLDEVEFRVLTDPGSRYESLSAGDLDLMVTNSPTQVAELGTELPDDQILLQEAGAGDEEFVLFNTQSGPTSDVRVRQALQLATDRQAINDLLYDGYFELAEAPYADDSDWYTDPGWPEPDLTEATRLVEEWEAENGPLTVTLTTFNTQDDLELGQALQAQWSEVGVETVIESTTESSTAEVIPFGDYEASLTHLFGGSDPDEHYPFWDPDEENIGGPGELSINFSRYTSETTRDALHLGRETGDFDERKAAYAEVWKDWAENVPYLWLYHKPQVLVATNQVKGLETFTTPDGEPADSFVGGSLFPTELWRE
jgi:ABC-type transport system substrate-binding protein